MKNKVYINLQNIQELFDDGSIELGKLNAVVAPMGCGKTTLIKEILTKNEKAFVFYPYITNKTDYKPHKNHQGYFTKYVTDRLATMPKNVSIEDFYQLYQTNIQDWLEDNKPSLILLDEGDFFFIQANKIKSFGFTSFKAVNYELIASQLTYLTLKEFSKFCPTISFSASRFKLPKDVKEMIQYDTSFIKEHIINIEPNTEIESFTVLNPDNYSNSTIYDFVMDWIGDSKALIYKSKWNKPLVDRLIEKNSLFLSRQDNFPFVTDELSGTRIPYGSLLENNYKEIGIEGSQLSDELFQDRKIVSVGVSSCRSVSLVSEERIKVIVFDNTVTASSIQHLGRPRFGIIDVLWIGKVDINLALSFDPFFNLYCPTIKEASLPLNWLLADYKDSVDDYLASLGSDTIPTFSDYQSKGGLANTKQYYFYCKELGYVKPNTWVKGVSTTKGSRVGKAVGKSIGKSISTTTQQRRDTLNLFLATNPKGSYATIHKQYLAFMVQYPDIKPMSLKGVQQFIINKGE